MGGSAGGIERDKNRVKAWLRELSLGIVHPFFEANIISEAELTPYNIIPVTYLIG